MKISNVDSLPLARYQFMKTSSFGIGTILIFVAVANLTGCTHYLMRGSVVEKESADEAQVCLGDHEVQVGDKVTLYKAVCKSNYVGKANISRCYKERVGAGTITSTLNEHMSIIKVDPGVEFKEGTIVEKE
jgi:hypothetical protein